MDKKIELLHKAEIAERMAAKSKERADSKKLTKSVSKEALDILQEVVIDILEEGKGAQLIGFLTIAPKVRLPRKGYNPLTEKQIDIEAKVGVTSSLGKNVKRAVEKLDVNDFI